MNKLAHHIVHSGVRIAYWVIRAFRSGQELLKGHNSMKFGLIGDMFLCAIFTQVNMTNLTVHGGQGGFTRCTAHNVLPTVVRVHDWTLSGKPCKMKHEKVKLRQLSIGYVYSSKGTRTGSIIVQN